MYDRVVDVPRLVATWPDDGPGHPLLPTMQAALAARHGRPLPRVSLAAYRSGQDSRSPQDSAKGTMHLARRRRGSHRSTCGEIPLPASAAARTAFQVC